MESGPRWVHFSWCMMHKRIQVCERKHREEEMGKEVKTLKKAGEDKDVEIAAMRKDIKEKEEAVQTLTSRCEFLEGQRNCLEKCLDEKYRECEVLLIKNRNLGITLANYLNA